MRPARLSRMDGGRRRRGSEDLKKRPDDEDLVLLKKRTVLVLGAGASQPFGFPTGIQLSQQLISGLIPGHNPAYIALTAHCGFSEKDISSFRDSFFKSGRNSVDAFLESRREFIGIGKSAIAAILIRYEQDTILFEFDNNWLRYVYNSLDSSFDGFGDNALAIITFNYDRSVENFFFQCLKNTDNKPDGECKTVLERIPIIHLHGQLGLLPWQDPQGRAYTPHLDKQTLMQAAHGIKIVHEDITDGRDKDFERAKLLLKNAEQILFMGFGYNRTNMARLEIEKLGLNRAQGTCVGLGDQETANIRSATHDSISLIPGDCLHFVRERLIWD